MKSSTYDQSNHWGLIGVYGLRKRYIFALGLQVGKHTFPSSVHNPLLQIQTPNTHRLKSFWYLLIHYTNKNKLFGRNIEINRCLFSIFIILEFSQNNKPWNTNWIGKTNTYGYSRCDRFQFGADPNSQARSGRTWGRPLPVDTHTVRPRHSDPTLIPADCNRKSNS